ncbi:hypothetical protein ACLB2K_076690 [Fragaria x ananassa]
MREVERVFARNSNVIVSYGLHPGRPSLPPQPPPSRFGLAADHLHLLGALWAAILVATVFTLGLRLCWGCLHGGRRSDLDWKRHPSWFWCLLDDEIGVLLEVGTMVVRHGGSWLELLMAGRRGWLLASIMVVSTRKQRSALLGFIIAQGWIHLDLRLHIYGSGSDLGSSTQGESEEPCGEVGALSILSRLIRNRRLSAPRYYNPYILRPRGDMPATTKRDFTYPDLLQEKATANSERLAAIQRRCAEIATVICKQQPERAADIEAVEENKKTLQYQNVKPIVDEHVFAKKIGLPSNQSNGKDFPLDEPTSKEETTLSINDEEPKFEATEIMDNYPNDFGGTLPTSISNLSTNLEILWVPQNKLHGSIPTGLGNLVNLQSLAMGENSFTGNIPNIGKLSKLVQLSFPNNQLSGRIPSTLGNLTMLITLELQGNILNGSTPSSLAECHSLLTLDLSRNNLDGTITQQLLNGLISLSISLNLSNNHFSGSLPTEIGKLKNLGALDISDNLLSGQLTSSLGSCESLEVLHLQGNFFNGVIPSSFNNLRDLRDLDLSRNNLSGEVPQFFERFGNLENLNLSLNQFWGALPTGGVFKNGSVTSVAGNTRLCGGIGNLQLSMCKSNASKGGGLSRIMKLMISLVSGFTLLGLVVVLSLFLRHKKKKESELSTLGNSVLQVSYATILKATDEFSSSNLIGVGAFGPVYKGILSGDSVTVAVKVFNMLHRGASKSFISEYYLHNNCETPIVHCDLKPSNVLLDSDMTGHVSDFGLSRFLRETTTNVSGNQSSSIGIRGSVGYAAPEYGMGSEVSAYGDVYSFGILLLEMFTGKRPIDHFFSDGMNLHNYVKTALPERVPEISESIILVEGTTITDETRSQLTAAKTQKIKECLTLIFGIGIVCSSDSPTNRKDISDVLVELQSIRNNLLG